MTDEFILEHLKKWVPLFYGKDKKPFAHKDGDYYCFGFYPNVLNRISKPVATFLVCGHSDFMKYLKSKEEPIKRVRTK
jgi:hypothetical protein